MSDVETLNYKDSLGFIGIIVLFYLPVFVTAKEGLGGHHPSGETFIAAFFLLMNGAFLMQLLNRKLYCILFSIIAVVACITVLNLPYGMGSGTGLWEALVTLTSAGMVAGVVIRLITFKALPLSQRIPRGLKVLGASFLIVCGTALFYGFVVK